MIYIVMLVISRLYVTDLILLVPKYTLCKYDHTPRRKKLFWKAACIGVPLLVFLATLILSYIWKVFDYKELLLFIGMFLCAIVDIVLEIRFLKGGLLFLAGHLVYVASLILTGGGFNIISLSVYVVLALAGVILTFKKLGKKYRFALLAYNFVISATFALSIPLIISFKPENMILGIGACFLVISDWLLARNKVFKTGYYWSLLSLVFYFGGQILISIFPMLNR
ncbi:MAG: hypothetical protein J6Y09_05120 [Lachnospiraceae bacterium]|nr:hypothetical protein [Lachnospiraceae bacterium]